MGNKHKKKKKHRGWQESKSRLMGAFDKIKNDVTKGWDSASNFYHTNVTPLVDKAQEGANKVSELANNQALVGAASGIAEAIDPEGGAQAVQKIAGVASGAGEAVSDLRGLGHAVGSSITGALEGAKGKSGVEAAKALVSGAKQAKGASAAAISEFSRKYKGGALGATYPGTASKGSVAPSSSSISGLSKTPTTIATTAGPSDAETTTHTGTERTVVTSRTDLSGTQSEMKPGTASTTKI